MIQNQLIEYINNQTKLGVSRDAIRSALVGAGWSAADVDDTLKSVEPAKAAQPVASAPAGSVAAASATKPSGAAAAGGPQIIKVSDLVSASPSLGASPSPSSSAPSSMPSGTAFKDAAKSPLTGPASSSAKPSSLASMPIGRPITASSSPIGNMAKVHASRGARITEVVLAVLFVAAAAGAGFLYYQNNNLAGQVAALNSKSSQVNLELSTLQNKTNASTSALTAQVGTLTGETQELQSELAFYAIPLNASTTATSTLVSGTVALGARGNYVITGAYGAKIFVANSRASSTIAALTPLVGTSTASQFTGTFVPGSGVMTLTAVNGSSL